MDMGVNLYNQTFWKLHGLIERVWLHYRELHGEAAPDDDPQLAAMIADMKSHLKLDGVSQSSDHMHGMSAVVRRSNLNDPEMIATRKWLADLLGQ
jgi:hypothetical protein